jgi:uncharacterized protein (DUF1786 family)
LRRRRSVRKILAIDIGAGTEDILLYDEAKNVENCVKMILPAPSIVHAASVDRATMLGKGIFVRGYTIGGGEFASSVMRHLEKGFRAIMTESAAYSIRNDLDEVEQIGVEVCRGEEPPEGFNGEVLDIGEVNLKELDSFLSKRNVNLSDVDVVAIAVQDHGDSPKGMSNRRFRIEKMREQLSRSKRPEDFAFKEDEVPEYFIRMNSAVRASKSQFPNSKVIVADTSIAAISGCLQDCVVAGEESVLAVNLGNGHTTAAIVLKGEICGIAEHHTQLLTPKRLTRLLKDFADRELRDEDVFNEGGHGVAFARKLPSFSKIGLIAATGPNRHLIEKAGVEAHFAVPAGDMMMTGPMGLVAAAKRKYQ